MDANAIGSVTIAVIALTQLAKWQGVADRYGPIVVLILSALGVGFWGYSVGTFERTQAFSYFSAWILVATSAAGVFGFTRAAPEAVTSIKPPSMGGAGSSPTVKS